MRVEHGQIPGGPITEDLDLRGQALDDLTVPSGRRLLVYGQVAGHLVIESGGDATVHGQVARDVVNRGSVEIHGMVVGQLHDHSGNARVAPGAEILGQ